MFHFTTNKSRLRTESAPGGAATFRRRVDVDEVVYVADIEDTNLLLIVVDGHPRRALTTTLDTTLR